MLRLPKIWLYSKELFYLKYRFEYPVLMPWMRYLYFPVPKNACTSIKRTIFKKRTGIEYEKFFFFNKEIYIHHIFPSRKFNPDMISRPEWGKFCVVRDPVDRFLSFYANRVLYHNDLNLPDLATLDLNDFISNIEYYININKSIRQHSRSQVYFLGRDPSFFDIIIYIKHLSTHPFIKEAFPEGMPKVQDGGSEWKKTLKNSLSRKSILKIEELYKEDYKVLGKFFRI